MSIFNEGNSNMSEQSTPFVEVKGKYGDESIHEATKEEIQAAKALKKDLEYLRQQRNKLDKQIETMEKTCRHTVSVDTAGWPYDIRSCFACGAGQGLV